MRAILAAPADADHPDGLLLERQLPLPEPGPRDLRVRIQAVAVNPVDLKVQAGLASDAEPKLLGWDAAGVVEATGAGVTRFRCGDGVFFAGDIGRPGCFAEQALVDERIAGPCPPNLSWAEAAALPLTSLTAWEALFEQLRLDPAERRGVAHVVGERRHGLPGEGVGRRAVPAREGGQHLVVLDPRAHRLEADGRQHGERASGPGDYLQAILRSFRTGQGHPFLYDTVWDVLRLVDYLSSRRDIDSGRGHPREQRPVAEQSRRRQHPFRGSGHALTPRRTSATSPPAP